MTLDHHTDCLGYSHPDYARSFADVGTLQLLDSSQGWIIERAVGNSGHVDAMGLYPLFSCRDWAALPTDLERLRDTGLVSLTLVSDPLLSKNERGLFSLFDTAKPFKAHYLADLELPIKELVSKHHAYYTRRAAREVEVELIEEPIKFLDEWCKLYAQLISKYQIEDMRAFSKQAFASLLAMPCVFVFRAVRHGKTVGAQIIIVQGEVAFAHLAAFSDEGYDLGASYLLDRHALDYFRGRARYLNWGGGRSASVDDKDGLATYKRGWSSTTGVSYLLGSVFNQVVYKKLCESAGCDQSADYFPAYRAGEFGPDS